LLHALSLGFVLYVLWFLLSGHTEPLLLSLGVASAAVCVHIANRMDVIDHEGFPIHLSWRAILYWPWLLWEIAKANVNIARVIIQPRMPISPSVFRVKASQMDELGHAIFANSITLTPGTVSVDLHDGEVMVHALTRAARAGLETGEMDAKVVEMEGAFSVEKEKH